MMKRSFYFALGFFTTSLASANPSVQCWGNNSQGQTTVPTDFKMNTVPAKPLEVRTTRGATCALDQSGKISCWGLPLPGLSNLQAVTGVKSFGISPGGSCALTTTTVQCFSAMGDTTFEAVPTFKNPKNISVGGSFACASDANGLQCWGGQSNATNVPQLKNLKKFLTGESNTCAIDDNGLQCWGDGVFALEQVPTLTSPKDFVLGMGFACATDNNGTQCWGNPQQGAQTLGITLPAIPTIAGLLPTTQFVAGSMHVCGLDKTGVHCWGDSSLNQLSVPSLSHPTAIYADALGNQTCATDDSGLVCWGEDQGGQSSLSAVNSISAGLGNTCAVIQGKLECWGSGSKTLTVPLTVSDAYQVSLGSNFACAMDISGAAPASCWGDNTDVQPLSPALPTVEYTQGNQLTSSPTLVATGYDHACTFSSQNGLACFGNNDFGQAKAPANFISSGGSGSVSAGGNHTCAIDVTGAMQCWGENEYGEATPLPTLQHPRQVSAGFFHTCALDANGVSCWGRSSEGQINVPKLVNPRLVQAGGYHTCALDDNGVTCWGENSFGQSTVPSNLVMPNQGHKVTALSTGQFHTCVATQ
jgi:alpha-tubulin suppressor-like RCC1 family protein